MEEVKEGILAFLEKEIELIAEDYQYERPVKNIEEAKKHNVLANNLIR